MIGSSNKPTPTSPSVGCLIALLSRRGNRRRGSARVRTVGRAVDVKGGWVYWTEKGPVGKRAGTICRAPLEGHANDPQTARADAIEVLFSGLPGPVDIELDVSGGMIYWADREDDTISRAPMEIPKGFTAADRPDRQVIVRAVRKSVGIAIDRHRGRIYCTGASGQLGWITLDVEVRDPERAPHPGR